MLHTHLTHTLGADGIYLACDDCSHERGMEASGEEEGEKRERNQVMQKSLALKIIIRPFRLLKECSCDRTNMASLLSRIQGGKKEQTCQPF